ncbi:MAG: hypothetical protein RLW87_08020 [Alphaproteobacteria bacterium]
MVVLPYAAALLAGALGWAYVTREDGETETVWERVTTNLGAAGVVAAAAVAAVWVWRKGR